MHLVMCGHFRSRDEGAGHNIQSAIAENPTLSANFMAPFYRTGVIVDRSFTLLE